MTHQTSTSEKVTLGFWIYLMSDCVLFAGLFATFAVLHTQTFGAISISGITNLPYVLVETLLLLSSSFTMGLALLWANEHNKTYSIGALMLTLALGFGFLGLEVNEFIRLVIEGNGPASSAALSAFFVLLGTHGLHVALGSIWMLVVMIHLIYRGFTPGSLRKLTCLALFWHFLDIIWIFIFTFVYLYSII